MQLLISAQFPPKLRPCLRRASLFYLAKLLNGRPVTSLFVHKASPEIAKRCEGLCERIDDVEGRFRISLRQCSLTKLLQILAHEFVHLAQFVRGDLTYALDEDGDRVFQWCGTLYPPMLNMVAAKIYDETPWEQEAIAQDASLANAFIDHAIKRGWLTEDAPAVPDGGA